MKQFKHQFINIFILLIFLISNRNIVVQSEYNSNTNESVWELIADNVETTVYNAVPEQCDKTPQYTASMFKLNLKDVYSHKIIAMEKTFMKKLGLKYGDVVMIEGTGKWDGVWQIQDTMNPKYAGRKKIDLLVPNNIKTGKWTKVKIYSLVNKEDTHLYTSTMAPQYKLKKI